MVKKVVDTRQFIEQGSNSQSAVFEDMVYLTVFIQLHWLYSVLESSSNTAGSTLPNHCAG